MAVKVLVVDDEKDIRELLERFLTRKGFEVQPVDNGIIALETIKNDPTFDILVLDNRMPGIDGTEVIRELAKREKKIPVIMLTGSLVINENHLQADAMLRKPIDLNELLNKINEVLGKQEDA